MKLFGGFENNFSLFCKIVIYCFSVFNIVCSKGEYIGNFEINNKYFDLYIFFSCFVVKYYYWIFKGDFFF